MTAERQRLLVPISVARAVIAPPRRHVEAAHWAEEDVEEVTRRIVELTPMIDALRRFGGVPVAGRFGSAS